MRKFNVENKDSLTIVINTCDLYSDVLELFFAAFKEFWPNCPYSIVINSETNNYQQYDFASTHLYSLRKHNSWGERLLQTLKAINSEYVLMLYDDFILESMVNTNKIKSLIDLLENNERASVVYLIHTSLPSISSEFDGLDIVCDNIEYRLNSSPAIWRRNKLIEYTGEFDNPWAWEVFGSYRTFNDGAVFYTLNDRSSDIYSYNYKKGGAIYRGRWVKEVIEDKFKKYMIDIDPNKRGYSENATTEARSLIWKVKFMYLGYKMVGMKSLRFLGNYIKVKING